MRWAPILHFISTISLLCCVAGAAFAAEQDLAPVGDETFEGSFSCHAVADRPGSLPCQSQINPALPVFDYIIAWHDDRKTGGRIIDRLDITRHGEPAPFQVIDTAGMSVPRKADNNGFESIDLNFDGYLDMRLLSSSSGAEKRYRNWLWSRNEEKFVPSPALDEVPSPDFDAENREITSSWRAADGALNNDVYSYMNDVPVLIHREADKGKGASCQRIFYDRVDDDLRKTGTGPCS